MLKPLLPFFAITFGLAWGMILLLILCADSLRPIFGAPGAGHPMFILAVYAPAIAACVLVLNEAGTAGLYRYLSRLFLWRVHWGWYAFLLIGVPALYFLGAVLKGNLHTVVEPFADLPGLLGALLFMLVLGPIEEIGWRGFALPILQRRLAPLWAGALLGTIWGLWHLPAFYLGGAPQSAWPFLPFLLGAIALGIIVTPLFNASGGSILLPLLLHWQLNNPMFPDAAPQDTLFFLFAALLVVLVNRQEMFSREKAYTEVVPAAPSAFPTPTNRRERLRR